MTTPAYRYFYNITTGALHDLRSPMNPDNTGCEIDAITDWISFDTRKSPEKNITIRKLTKTREVVDIDVRTLCHHCIDAASETEEIVDLLREFLLKKAL